MNRIPATIMSSPEKHTGKRSYKRANLASTTINRVHRYFERATILCESCPANGHYI